MAYELTIACGVALAALLTIGLITRGAASLLARLVRRALLFLLPFFLVWLLVLLYRCWLKATTDIIKAGTTIGQLEAVIALVQVPAPLHEALQGQNAVALGIGLIGLAGLAFVRLGIPHLGIGKEAATGVAAVYAVVTAIAAGVFFGHGAVRDIDARIERLRGHIDDVERKASDYKKGAEEAVREIVKDALIEVLDVASIQEQLNATRARLRAAQDEIEPYGELLQTDEHRSVDTTLESDFADTWHGIRKTLNTLHWNRKFVRPVIPEVGRSDWSTLRFYEASTDLRNDKLSRPKKEPSELRDVVAKTFDIVLAADGRPDVDAVLAVGHSHPLAPLVVSLVDVWYEPLKALSTTQAEALFDATVTQRQPFADAAAVAQKQVHEAVASLRTDLQPALEQVTGGLQRLQGQIARLPQTYRRLAEESYPQRLQTFRLTWHRLLSFPSPGATRAATVLRQQIEAILEAQSDPFRKHAQLAAYEQTLQTLAGRLDDSSRYQALLRFEQQHSDTRTFARFTKEHVESRLATLPELRNARPAETESLAVLEAQSQWLETHRLAVAGMLDDPESEWEPETRDRTLRHLAFDLQFVTRAIRENYKPETYTPVELRKRLRAYSRLAAALEPVVLEGVEFRDTLAENFTGHSRRGALRFQVVDLIARIEARLRLTPTGIYQKVTAAAGQLQLVPSATSLQLADLLRAERDHIAVYQNRSEESYVAALSGLWQEADQQPERGAKVSAIVVASLEDDSRRLKVPAAGALRALRRLVQQSKDIAQEVTRLGQELTTLETPDAALNKAFTASHQQFLRLQEQIRQGWAKTRRQLHIRAANRSR